MRTPGMLFASLAALALLPAPGVARAAGQREVVIEAMRFAPQTVEAQVGDVVVWSNRDPFPHTIAADRGEFASDMIVPGGAWRMQAARRGVFPYTCGLHPTMHGVLVVK